MSDTLHDRLAAVARRMTRANVVRWTLTVLCVAAVVLSVVTFAAGRSPVAVGGVGAIAAMLVILAVPRLRRRPVDAARRIEQREGWQEQLSTAYELGRRREENVFFGRLSDEAKQLAERIDPGSDVPLRLLRPAVAAAAAWVVLAALWLGLPGGMRGVLSGRQDARNRDRAQAILAESADRLERLAPQGAAAREMRMRLVGLMNDLRRRTDTTSMRRRAERLAREGVSSAVGEAFEKDIRARAAALDESARLQPLAAALRLRNPAAFRRESERLAHDLPSMDKPTRDDAAAAFSSAAEGASGAGLSEPLKDAATAMREADPAALDDALRRFEQNLRQGIDAARRDAELAADYERALQRVRAVLAGANDPGPATKAVETRLSMERSAPVEDNAISGNLLVHGPPPELDAVATSGAASGTLPDVAAIRKAADEAARANPRLDPRTRLYVKRYFGKDDDTE